MRSAVIALAIVSALLLSAANSPIASAAAVNAASITNQTTATKKIAVKTAAAEKPVAKPAAVTTKSVVVSPGDYLTKLAAENNSTVQRLYDANTAIENPDLIFPGQELRIPDEQEVIAHRDMPVASAVGQQVQAEAQAAGPRSYTPSNAPAVTDGSVWDRLAACEAGGNWAINTGNGYYGGLQFSLSSWQAVGGSGYPNQASREEQILRGSMLQARSGWGQWPACSAKLGL
jgi:LysM repeat protein